MEALSNILQPYKDIVATVAAVVTIAQMFSAVFICRDIIRQGNTKGISVMTFAGGLIITILNLKYGMILRDDTMVNVNLFGLALNIIYSVIYFNYASEKVKTWAQFGASGAFVAAVLGYAEYEDPAHVEYRFGLIVTAFMFYLLASPLLFLGDIIKNQSTEGLPFPIIFSATIVTFMWLLYGIVIKNNFLVIQNAVAFFLCAFQLSLFVIYPSKPKGKKDKLKAKKAD